MQDPGPSFQPHFDFSSPSAFNHHFAHCGDNTLAPTDTSSSPSSFPLSSLSQSQGVVDGKSDPYSSFDQGLVGSQLGHHSAFQALTSSPSHMEGDISPASSSTSPIRPRFDMSGNGSDLHTAAFSSGMAASQMGHGSWSSTPATSATDAGGSPNSCAGMLAGLPTSGQSAGVQGAEGANSQSASGKPGSQEEVSSMPLSGAASSSNQKAASPVKSTDPADLAAAEKKLQAKFVYKVYSMCEDPDCQHLIKWSENGKSVFIHNFEEFSKDVLGKHFKHQNFSSFIRQLNMYGFYKVNKSNKGAKASAESAVWEFSHPKFQRGRADLLEGIKRKVLDTEQVADVRGSVRPPNTGESAPYSIVDQETFANSSVSNGHNVKGTAMGPAPTVYSGMLTQAPSDINGPSQLLASHKALRLQVDSLQSTLAQMALYTRQLGDTVAHVVEHARRTSAANSADGLPTIDIQMPVANFAVSRFPHSPTAMQPHSPLQPVFTSPTPTFTSGQHPSHADTMYERQRFDSRPEIYVTEPPLGLGHPHPSESSGWSSTTPTGPSGAYMTRDTRRSNSTPGPVAQGSTFIRMKTENGEGGMAVGPNALTIDTQYANFGSGRSSNQHDFHMGPRPGGLQQRSASMYTTLQGGSSHIAMAVNTPLPPSPSVNDFTATGLPGYGSSNSAAGSVYGTSPESFDSSMRLASHGAASVSSGGGGGINSGAGTPTFLTTTSPFMASFPGGVSSELSPGGVSDFGALTPNSNGGSSYGGSSRGSRSPGRGSVSRGASASSQERPAPYPHQHSAGKVPSSPGGGMKRKSPA